MEVRELLRQAAHRYRDRDAVVDGTRRTTFGEAWKRGCRFANLLAGLGLETGDRVGVLDHNSLASVDAFLGCAIANLVRVPLYPRNGVDGHRHMLEHTGCRVLIVDADMAESVVGLIGVVPGLERVIVRDGDYEALLATSSSVDPIP